VDRFGATSYAIAWFSLAPGFRRVTPYPAYCGTWGYGSTIYIYGCL